MLGLPYGVLVEERPLAGITQFSLLSKRKPLGSEQYVRRQSYPVPNLWKDSFATFQFTMGHQTSRIETSVVDDAKVNGSRDRDPHQQKPRILLTQNNVRWAH